MIPDDETDEAEQVRLVVEELNRLFGGDAGTFAMKQLGPGMYAAVFDGDMSDEQTQQLEQILAANGASESFRVPDGANIANIFAHSPTETLN